LCFVDKVSLKTYNAFNSEKEQNVPNLKGLWIQFLRI